MSQLPFPSSVLGKRGPSFNNEGLVASLKAYRLREARSKSLPAYCVFSNKELDRLVEQRPSTLRELQRIKGFGARKVEMYGVGVLACINSGAPLSTFSAKSSSPMGSIPTPSPSCSPKSPSGKYVTFTAVGHTLKIAAVQKKGGVKEGKWYIRCSGPSIGGKRGIKTLYCDPSIEAAKVQVANFLQCPVSAIVPMENAAGESISSAGNSSILWTSTGPDVMRHTSGSSGSISSAKSEIQNRLAPPPTCSPSPILLPTASAPIDTTAHISSAELTSEQVHAALEALEGKNCFFTGAAGTGKSFLLKYVIQQFKKMYRDENQVAVTAPTGVAATNIAGRTLHSWAGIGLGKGSPDQVLDKVLRNSKACARWRKCAVLIIDEISMLDSNLFSILDMIGRKTRKNEKPFGGLQLVTCGDFFQLPPVGLGRNIGRTIKTFAFKSMSWIGCGMRCVVLRNVIRQAGDERFVRMLNELRCGIASKESLSTLAKCHVQVKPYPSDGIVPTKLYCVNRSVDAENISRLNALPGTVVRLNSRDTFKGAASSSSSAQKHVSAMLDKRIKATLEMKIGAQVVLLVNRPKLNLVNGSRGIIVGFEQCDVKQAPFGVPQGRYMCPRVRFDSGRTHVIKPTSFFQGGGSNGALVRVQIPLKLAWALTVHKSQGMTLSRVQVMVGDAFEYGQAYVALSRATDLNGLWLCGPPLNFGCIKAHPDVVEFYNNIS